MRKRFKELIKLEVLWFAILAATALATDLPLKSSYVEPSQIYCLNEHIYTLSTWYGKEAFVVPEKLTSPYSWYPKDTIRLPDPDTKVVLSWIYVYSIESLAVPPGSFFHVRVWLNFALPENGLVWSTSLKLGPISSGASLDSLLGTALTLNTFPLLHENPTAIAPANVDISSLLINPPDQSADFETREIVRRLDISPYLKPAVDSIGARLITTALINDPRLRHIVTHARTEIRLAELKYLTENRDIVLASFDLKYRDFSRPDSMIPVIERSFSVGIELATSRLFIVRDKVTGFLGKNIIPLDSDIDALLKQLQIDGAEQDEIVRIIEDPLLRYLIYPERGMVLRSLADTCLLKRSLWDDTFLDLAEADTSIGYELAADLVSERTTPNLFDIWDVVYPDGCGVESHPELFINNDSQKSWVVLYRTDSFKKPIIERFVLEWLTDGSISFIRAIIE